MADFERKSAILDRPHGRARTSHYWTPDHVKMILNAMPAGQRWLFDLWFWRTVFRQAEALNLAACPRKVVTEVLRV